MPAYCWHFLAGSLCICQVSVRPSVCPIRPPQAAAAGLLLLAQHAGECGQCHIVSIRRKLSSDLSCLMQVTYHQRCGNAVIERGEECDCQTVEVYFYILHFYQKLSGPPLVCF